MTTGLTGQFVIESNWNSKIEIHKIKHTNFRINIFNLTNRKVVLAPSLCGENCFRVIRDMSDCISFPDERNESLLVIFKKPIWPPSGNKNRYREYGIENLPHEAPGAPKIFRFERLNIFRTKSLYRYLLERKIDHFQATAQSIFRSNFLKILITRDLLVQKLSPNDFRWNKCLKQL